MCYYVYIINILQYIGGNWLGESCRAYCFRQDDNRSSMKKWMWAKDYFETGAKIIRKYMTHLITGFGGENKGMVGNDQCHWHQ